MNTKRYITTNIINSVIPGKTDVRVIPSADVTQKLVKLSSEHDLVIMGLGKPGAQQKTFGKIPLTLAGQTDSALIFIYKK